MTSTGRNEKFENLIDLELAYQGAKVDEGFRSTGTPLYRVGQLKDATKRAKAALYSAIDELTADEMAAYGPYRAEFFASRQR